MKRGLALEGGGARGAYHIGAVKALIENGYTFDGFVGTSIGAVNAAVLAQGDFEKALDIWTNISLEQLFDENEHGLLHLVNIKKLKLNTETTLGARKALTKVISSKGINTEKMIDFLKTHINEEKVRSSGKDFGLVTVSLTERKPYELMLDDIPQGKLVDYIMASASFPGFRPQTIEGKKYLDGAVYNNCPVNLLAKLDYDEIIAIRINSLGLVPLNITKMKNVKIISPKGNLGRVMMFSSENSAANLKLGYCDGLRFVKKLRGSFYYINPLDDNAANAQLMSINDSTILEIGKILGLTKIPPKRMLFEKIIPRLSAYLELEKNYDYEDFLIALLEQAAKQKGIDQFQVYDYNQLRYLTKNAPTPKNSKKPLDKLITNTLMARKKAAAELLINKFL